MLKSPDSLQNIAPRSEKTTGPPNHSYQTAREPKRNPHKREIRPKQGIDGERPVARARKTRFTSLLLMQTSTTRK